jgi:hypothetical protein
MVVFSEKDIFLLGYKTANPLDTHPEWALYKATVCNGLRTSSDYFIYLKSAATQKGIDELNKNQKLNNLNQPVYIIKSKSLKLKNETITKSFSCSIEIRDFEDLSWESTKTIFSSYTSKLKHELPDDQHFISPHPVQDISGKSGEKIRLDDYLTEFFANPPNDVENIKVLIADAGVGKTTLARRIVHKLIDQIDVYKIIPIYVEASHWSKIHIEALDTFWELIVNSLRIFDENISIPDEVLFNHVLSLGKIVLIFDGFDELCIKKITNFTPESTIKNLANMANDGKILITSRKIYWDSISKDSIPGSIDKIEIARFNKPMVIKYFEEYFKQDPQKSGQVKGLYGELNKGSSIPPEKGGFNARIVNLPLVISMLANFVETGGAKINFQTTSGILPTILDGFCQREVERQHLKTSPENQLTAFEEIVLLDTHDFEISLLEPAGFDCGDIEKLKDHPLILVNSEKYCLRYEFLYPYFKARRIWKDIESDKKEEIFKIIKNEMAPGNLIQEHLYEYFNEQNIKLFAALCKDVPTSYSDSKSFIFHLVKDIIWKSSESLTQKEKTNRLANLLNNDFQNTNFDSLVIYGRFSDLDISDTEILNTRFRDTYFSNLKSNSNTIFKKCIFEGDINFEDIEAAKKITYDKYCSATHPANIIMSSIFVDSPDNIKEIVFDSLILAAKKFWKNGRYKLTIEKNYWNRGVLRFSPIKEKLVEKFKKYNLIEEVNVSGVSEGCYRFPKKYTTDLRKLMDNRTCAGPFKKIFDELIHEWVS